MSILTNTAEKINTAENISLSTNTLPADLRALPLAWHPYNGRDSRKIACLEPTTLQEVYDRSKYVRIGGKYEDYFIRGALYEKDGRLATGRCRRLNSNMRGSRLLVIDADGGAGPDGFKVDKKVPAPQVDVAEEVLQRLGINYFGYHSFSWKPDFPKYRIIVPTQIPFSVDELRDYLVADFFSMLQKNGLAIGFGTEMKIASIPWYFPMAKSADNQFRFFEHWDGAYYDPKTAREPDIFSMPSPARNENDASIQSQNLGSAFDPRAAIDGILKADNYHDSLRGLALHFINKKIDENETILLLQSLMNASNSPKDERWHDRYDDIPRAVKSALEKVESEKDADNEGDAALQNRLSVIADQESTKVDGLPPEAPGRLGELAAAALRFQHHPNELIATVTALGLVAGIAGRRFNVSETGLNLYLTLLADSGIGKDSIRKFVRRCLGQHPMGDLFVGDKRFTGPAALHNNLMRGRSFVSVMTEAGLLAQSTAGDQAGFRRMALDIYTCSGKDDFTDREGYSSADNNLVTLRAPAFTLVSESTPKLLVDAMKKSDAANSGELARLLFFRCDGPRADENTNREFRLDADLAGHLQWLIGWGLKTNSSDDPEALDIPFSPEAEQLRNKLSVRYNSLFNESRGIDPIRAAMYSRAHVKALKLAALCAVMDCEVRDDKPAVLIEKIHLEWAESMIEFELSGVDAAMLGSSSDSMQEIIDAHVVPVVAKLLAGRYKSKVLKIPRRVAARNMFPLSALRECLRNCRAVNELADDPKRSSNPKSGFAKVVGFMVNEKMIRRVEGHEAGKAGSRSRELVQCLPNLAGEVDGIRKYL